MKIAFHGACQNGLPGFKTSAYTKERKKNIT